MKAFVDQRKAKPVFRRHAPVVRVDQAGRARCLQRGRIRQILHSPRPQAKLTIGAPDDVYEQEADRVADEVMRMPDPMVGERRVQRMCPECEGELQRQPLEEEDEEDLQRQTAEEELDQEEETLQTNRLLGHSALDESVRREIDDEEEELVGAKRTPTGGRHGLPAPRFKGDPILADCCDKDGSISWGTRGPAVKKIQQALLDTGCALPGCGADGTFKSETERAVKMFQRTSGLTGSDVDGRVGRTTLSLLDKQLEERASR